MEARGGPGAEAGSGVVGAFRWEAAMERGRRKVSSVLSSTAFENLAEAKQLLKDRAQRED